MFRRASGASSLAIATGSLFIVSYGFSTLGSAIVLDRSADPNVRRGAYANLAPVVGPLVAAGFATGSRSKAGHVALGLFQGATLTGAIAGTVAHRRLGAGRPPKKRTSQHILAGGGALLAMSYSISAAVGGGQISQGNQGNRALGQRLVVPLVGGYLAVPKARSNLAAWGCAFASTAQITGAALIALGAVRLSKLRVMPTVSATRNEASIGVVARF